MMQKLSMFGRRMKGSQRRLTLGLCCMASKATSPPMQAILRRLEACGDFIIEIFPEDTIVEKPVEEWPVVECLIAFASAGFPLEKCIAYCRLRKPTLVNDVGAQEVFRNRVAVYRTLVDWGVPCPDFVIIDHAKVAPLGPHVLVENENYIVFDGRKLKKPFVEKPQDGDRHDIWIYYPCSIGGGAKKLFRKVKDQSSEFDANQNEIRRDGVYIYEPFLLTQGTDIKVYTVGAGYVHAEARKAPTVDGKVQRSKDGKEVRYPVVLTHTEKAISAIIVKAFRQTICGFDILRTDGGSKVCDVNGWSFVKGSQKYYNDCSTLIRQRLLEENGIVAPISNMMILGESDEVVQGTFPEYSADEAMEEQKITAGTERLRSVLVVMRHGERRPKEKLKFKTKMPSLLAYFEGQEEEMGEVKLKSPEEMMALKRSCESALQDLKDQIASAVPPEASTASSDGTPVDIADAKKKFEEQLVAMKADQYNLELLVEVLDLKDLFAGLERKVQLKVAKWRPQKDSAPRRPSQVLVVAKWGGELTVSGLGHAEELGKRLRLGLYPNDPTGLLRLHSSFRHDFKIYSSQEGRCQITAAAFTKGFLDLEGDIKPILVSLVNSDSYAQALLDEPIPRKERDAVKQKIESLVMLNKDLNSPEVLPLACPTPHTGLLEAARRIGNPLALLKRLETLALEYLVRIAAAKEAACEAMRHHADPGTGDDKEQEEADDDVAVPLGQERNQHEGPGPKIPFDLKDSYKRKWLHLRRKEHRWWKLYHGFVLPQTSGSDDSSKFQYDISKIPDVWDNLYYDMLTHRHYLGEDSCRIAEAMVDLLLPLNEWLCPSEYGISSEEKLRIGVDVTWRLIGKILVDMEFMIQEKMGKLDEAGQSHAESVVCDSEGRPQTQSDISLEHSVSPRGDIASQEDLVSPVPSACQSPAAVNVDVSRLDAMSANGSVSQVPLEAPAAQRTLSWHANAGSGSVAGSGPAPLSQDAMTAVPSSDDAFSTVGQTHLKGSKLTRLTPKLRNELKHALRDASDWHPRLNEEVAKLTDIKCTRTVRSRIYVTSASTMHSLFNILRHGQGNGEQGDGCGIVSDFDNVTDLNYLTHIVFRCYERDAGAAGQGEENDAKGLKASHRVEIAMSPGVQVVRDGQVASWPEGREFRAENCSVAPLQVIADSVDLATFETFFVEVLKQFGCQNASDGDDEEFASD
mmetsp:Transcript_11145/g.24921  ORF Transcript_11145/g.24921 Transcript_11145/m.24921 type:complete len:1196 (+) Transcript_11145:120-3707(+)